MVGFIHGKKLVMAFRATFCDTLQVTLTELSSSVID